MKRFLAILLCAALWAQPAAASDMGRLILQEDAKEKETKEKKTEQVSVSAPSAILMEASTGQVIYEKEADSVRPPASVTKVMTLLLIFDALAQGRITLQDEVTTSEYAASMGGSQVFLEPGETQTVDTMIKCISVASANDACVSFNNRRLADIYMAGVEVLRLFIMYRECEQKVFNVEIIFLLKQTKPQTVHTTQYL